MKRRKFTAEFKAKIVLEALKERQSLADLGRRHKLGPTQISNWKKEFLAAAPSVFSKVGVPDDFEKREADLLRIIGELQVENHFLKNVMQQCLSHRRGLIDAAFPNLSIRRQCQILGLNRSSFYYAPRSETSLNLELMRLMDEHYLDHPYKGARRMFVWLTKDKGYQVSLNRIERLYYRVMGLRAILPGPHTSKRNQDHQVFPYLLRNLAVEQANQVWATDITYIPM